MNIETTAAVKELASVNACPFYLDQANSRCVWVKDAKGLTVFLESFTDFPDEMNANDREMVINTALAVAKLLVAISNTEYAKAISRQ